MVLLLGIATFIFTFLGGLFALKFKDKLHLILGFSAGAVIGVAFFDLIPESIELVREKFQISAVALMIAIGFVLFMVLDRFLQIHAHGLDEGCKNEKHLGFHGAIALIVHSFLDGLGIGLAFKVSTSVGIIVAVAVLAHDFSDGINTVNYVLKNNSNSKIAYFWLLLDASAPMLGIVSAFLFTVPGSILGLILAVFCGFFLYIGASDLIPESHHRHPTFVTTLMTILGISLMYVAIRLAG